MELSYIKYCLNYINIYCSFIIYYISYYSYNYISIRQKLNNNITYSIKLKVEKIHS